MGPNLYQNAITEDLDAKLKDSAPVVLESMGSKTNLHVESMHGSKENVLHILKNFGSKDLLVAVDSNQETALHLAAYFNHTGVVEVLIDEAKRLFSPVDFESFLRKTNGKKNTALHLAVTNHNEKIVKLLVEADPNARHIQNREGHSPIFLAAKRGYSDIVKLICKVCKSPTFDGRKGRTALHAVIKRLHEGMQLVLDFICLDTEESYEFVKFAAKKEDRDVVKILLETAKDIFAKNHNRYEEFVGQADHKDGDTALHLAVRGNHLAVVKLILQVNGPYKDKINRDYKTPLYIAAEKGYKDIVEVLCGESKFENTLGPRGQTVLHAAVIGRDPACVRHILRRETRLVTYGDEEGRTPLHYAAYYKFDSILDIIVKAQASVFYQSVYGDKVPTPLCVAAKEGHTSTVIRLMSLLPPPSCAAVNCDGQNILHLAAGQSDKEMIQCILKNCPVEYIDKILNHKDVDGDTPLHLLIREGCFVPELIKHKKVDTMAKNYHNWTPFDMLYFQDYVVRDQLQIKKALYDIQTNHQRESYINESLVPPSRRSKKDQGFRRAKENLMKKGLELYKERTSTQIIVTALITTVTFTVGFTVPGGLNQSGQEDEGLVLLSKKTAFRAFMVSDALALLLSTTSLFLYFISSMYRDPHQVSKLNHASTGLNIFSVIAMMLTFITGTYVVLSNSAALAITISVIGCIFFLIVIVLLIKMLNDRRNVEKFEV